MPSFCFLPLGKSAGFSGFLEAGYRDRHLDFEPKEPCSRLKWENSCLPMALETSVDDDQCLFFSS